VPAQQTPGESERTIYALRGGALLLSDTLEGRFIYVVAVGRYSNSGAPTGIYLRVAAPAR
jgi:hypothetical protein